jgi:hypothetical protein
MNHNFYGAFLGYGVQAGIGGSSCQTEEGLTAIEQDITSGGAGRGPALELHQLVGDDGGSFQGSGGRIGQGYGLYYGTGKAGIFNWTW